MPSARSTAASISVAPEEFALGEVPAVLAGGAGCRSPTGGFPTTEKPSPGLVARSLAGFDAQPAAPSRQTIPSDVITLPRMHKNQNARQPYRSGPPLINPCGKVLP